MGQATAEDSQSGEDWPVEIIRSVQRRKTVGAEIKGGVLIVRAPAGMSDAELAPIISSFQKRLKDRMARSRIGPSDEDLEQLAKDLNARYFAGKLRWQSIRYVTNQNKRYGSCTPSQGTIRISQRVAGMPRWVLTYVVMHEIAHLQEANHSPRFWRLVDRYPLTERARGYLMAVGLEEDEEDAGDG